MKHPPLLWYFLPVFALLFHYAYGERMQYAEGSLKLQTQARLEERSGHFQEASTLFAQAEKAAHPDDFALRARLRIENARSLTAAGNPLEAARQMERLLGARSTSELPDALIADVQITLALSLYYAAYALRLELAEPQFWRSELDGARQIFLALYQDAERNQNAADASFHARNLEATILLSRTRQAELVSLDAPPPVIAAQKAGISAKRQAEAE